MHTCKGNADSNPYGLLLASNGTVYGTTLGKAGDDGTLFSINSSSKYTLLYTFTAASDGNIPQQLVQNQRSGLIYGITEGGGQFNYGTLFDFNPTGNAFSVLYNFDEPGPSNPSAIVQHPNGKLYGSSYTGGVDDDGTLFSVTL